MENLRKLIESGEYTEAKAWILTNRSRIEEIADTLLSVIAEMEERIPVWRKKGFKFDEKDKQIAEELMSPVLEQSELRLEDFIKVEINLADCVPANETLSDLWSSYSDKVCESLSIPKRYLYDIKSGLIGEMREGFPEPKKKTWTEPIGKIIDKLRENE